MNSHFSDDEKWMRLAIEQAKLAALEGEIPVGAVLVKDGHCLATSHNLPIARHDPTAHAEMNVLREGAKQLQNYRLPGVDLYVTLEPCLMCAGAIFHARVNRVFFGAFDSKTGVAGGVINVFQETALNHHTAVQGGILEAECSKLLKDFFKNKRLLAH